MIESLSILLAGLYIYSARQTFLVMALSDRNRANNSFFTPGLIPTSARTVLLALYYAFWPLLMAYGWWNSRHDRVGD